MVKGWTTVTEMQTKQHY